MSLRGWPTCGNCQDLVDEGEGFIPGCKDSDLDYKCHTQYLEKGSVSPENELAWSVYHKIELVGGPTVIKMLHLDELPLSEAETLLSKMGIIKATVHDHEKAQRASTTPKTGKK